MKSFALLSLAAAVAAMPAPDHVVTELVTCTDSGYGAKETVTVTAPCGGSGGSSGGSSGGNSGNGGYPQAPVTVTVTKTETKTETKTYNAGGSSGGDSTPPPDHNTYPAGNPPNTATSTDLPPSDTSTTTSTNAPGVPATHTVAVGAFPRGTGLPPAFEFRPNNITAAKGDKVVFQMLSKEHSVTQSQFARPCVKSGPFDTELIPNAANATSILREFVVEDASKPLWMYCKQKVGNHCGNGMVFGINPKSDAQMQQFIDMAKQQNGTVPVQPTLPVSLSSAMSMVGATAVPTTVGGAVKRVF